MRTLILLFTAAALLTAQTNMNGGRTGKGAFDNSGATLTAPVRVGAVDPATCNATVREMFYNNATNLLKVCNVTDTWSVISGAGTTRTYPYFFQGTVQSAATGFAFNIPAATAPTLTNSGGTVPIGVLRWATGQTTDHAWATFLLPTGYVTNAAISYSLEYRSADSTHTSILTPSIACQGTSSTVDNPTFGAASNVNLTAGASSHQTVTSGTWTPNSGSIPACSAGQRVWIKLVIDTNTGTGSGALTQPFDLISATFSVQGGM